MSSQDNNLKEKELIQVIESFVEQINYARKNASVLFASDFNEELERIGIDKRVIENSRIVVDEMI